MFYVQSLGLLVGFLDVYVADPICLALPSNCAANDILLSWETEPTMFACVCECSITGFVISEAPLLDSLHV